jgi:hypothetical protein
MARWRWSTLVVALAVLSLPPASASASIILGQTGPSSFGDCSGGSAYTELQFSTAGPPSYTVPAGGGVITSWSHQGGASEAGQLKLKMYRVVTSPTLYTVVGQSSFTSMTPNVLIGGITRIPVQAGDVLGYTRAADSVMTCLINTVASGDVVRDAPGADTPDGMNTTFSSGSGQLRVNMTAVLEPDADHDDFGDETQDGCPTDPATQGGCGDTLAPATDTLAPATEVEKQPRKRIETTRKRSR